VQIPFVDLSWQTRIVRDDVDRAMEEIIDTSAFIAGPHVGRFEIAFAAYIGAKHAIGVGNGTDALHLALRACGIGPGDEVITAANTFLATVEAIGAVGATPVLVDADATSYTINPELVEKAITPRTRAIIPVHLYGQPADMAAVMDIASRHGLRVIEDACQSHGARYGETRTGAIGDIGCFSCYPGKNLGAFGDAGVVVTDDDLLADRVRLLANHGSRVRYHHEIEGWNSRLDTVQAAVLSAKLPYLDAWNSERQRLANLYQDLLWSSGVQTPSVVNGDHVWHLYVIEADDRDHLAERLADRGIATGIHYPLPIHLQPAYRHLGYHAGAFPVTERAARRILSLPMFPGLTDEQVGLVAAAVQEAAAWLKVA
jgi:dTDP-4-amino-4,6-dideoxygalactose transaminase